MQTSGLQQKRPPAAWVAMELARWFVALFVQQETGLQQKRLPEAWVAVVALFVTQETVRQGRH